MFWLVPRAKVHLFAELSNNLPKILLKNFHFVTICKVLGVKYNKMKAKNVYLVVYIQKGKI